MVECINSYFGIYRNSYFGNVYTVTTMSVAFSYVACLFYHSMYVAKKNHPNPSVCSNHLCFFLLKSRSCGPLGHAFNDIMIYLFKLAIY